MASQDFLQDPIPFGTPDTLPEFKNSRLINVSLKPHQIVNIHRAEKLERYEEIKIKEVENKVKKYVPLSKRQDKPDSVLWLLKNHTILKDSQIAKLVGVTKNSVSSIRNKSYWNYNNLNPKDPVALNLFSQKDLIDAIEKAERRIKREKKEKEKQNKVSQTNI